MNKLIKKMSKIISTFILVFAMLLGYIEPLTNVFALDNFDVVITFEVSNDSDVTLFARGDELVIKRGEGESYLGLEDTKNNTQFGHDSVQVVCESDKKCQVTVTVPNEHGVRAVTPGDANYKFLINGQEYGFDNENITKNTTLEVINNDDVRESFDGNAYLIWSCGDGTCYHLFEGISEEPMFIKASTIKADNDETKTFDVHATYKAFASVKDFDSWQAEYKSFNKLNNINFATLDASLVIGHIDMREYEEDAERVKGCSREENTREDYESCVDEYVAEKIGFIRRIGYQPVGEPTLNNAYVSYGDRNFKITIYNDDYRGVTIGSLESLEYYPAVWNDPFLRVESYDISGTDENSATVIDTVLLEPTVNIKALGYNEFEIQKIEALDVPNGAVNVTKTNGEFNIKFSSNFYDNVLFKVTTIDNNVYYFRINRMTIDAKIDHTQYGKNFISCYFYFDNKASYEDYVLTAKIVYKDGTFKKVDLKNTKEIDDGLGNKTYAYELDQEKIAEGPKGKGLKVAFYSYDLSEGEVEKISKIYINVEKAGSTKDTYAGAFAGSGKGVLINVEEELR